MKKQTLKSKGNRPSTISDPGQNNISQVLLVDGVVIDTTDEIFAGGIILDFSKYK